MLECIWKNWQEHLGQVDKNKPVIFHFNFFNGVWNEKYAPSVRMGKWRALTTFQKLYFFVAILMALWRRQAYFYPISSWIVFSCHRIKYEEKTNTNNHRLMLATETMFWTTLHEIWNLKFMFRLETYFSNLLN